MKYILITFISILMIGCGGSDSGESNKGVTSLWAKLDDSFSFDLSNVELPVSGQTMMFVFQAGQVCSCDIDVLGTELNGNYELSFCNYSGGGAGDPGNCGDLNSTGSYKAVGLNLELCESGSPCVTYK